MTDRALSTATLAAIATGAVKPIFLYEGEFSAGTLRLFTGYGTLTWNGHEWTGDGGLMQVSAIQEVSELNAVNFTVSLNGQVSALTAVALAQVRRGKPGSVWLGLLDATGTLITDTGAPYLCFKGRLDKSNIVPDPQSAVISIAYESRMIVATKPKLRRYTDEDQKIDYPADRGFEYVPSLQDKAFLWGRR